jgi:tRNA A-37 threonylcarbamoyl transferase component Bud32
MVSDSFPVPFGRYQLVERLAVGGMAELFKARVVGAHGFQKPVVIKKILPHLAVDAAFVAMFIDEAKITARLDHPKIAQVLELGTIDESLYIAMEFVDGLDVLAILRACAQRKQSLPAPIAAHICHEILDALDYAHQARDDDGSPLGIVHRDISPSNILISRRGDVKLADFGIAHALDRQQKTQAGMLKGKYGYMSPEQVIGGDLDGRSDLFAVGTVLSEMLMGRRLFTAPNELDVLLMVRDVKLDRLDRYGGGIEPDLRAIISKALQRDPRTRFPTAAVFRDTMAEYLFSKHHRVGPADLAVLVESLAGVARPTVPPGSHPGVAVDREARQDALVGPNTKANEIRAEEAARRGREQAAQVAAQQAIATPRAVPPPPPPPSRARRGSAPTPAPGPLPGAPVSSTVRPAAGPPPAPQGQPAAAPAAIGMLGNAPAAPAVPAAGVAARGTARPPATARPAPVSSPSAVPEPTARAVTAPLTRGTASPTRRPAVVACARKEADGDGGIAAPSPRPAAPAPADHEELFDPSSLLRELETSSPSGPELDTSASLVSFVAEERSSRASAPPLAEEVLPAPATHPHGSQVTALPSEPATIGESDFHDVVLEDLVGASASGTPTDGAGGRAPEPPAALSATRSPSRPATARPARAARSGTPVSSARVASPAAPATSPPAPSAQRLGRVNEDPDEEGDLSATPPIRILYRLAVEKASGLLVVEVGGSGAGGVTKEIYFAGGAPEFVASNLARELLGEYLVAQKVISQGELAMALAMMPHFGGKLGDTLVGLGLMKPLDVFRHLTRQVREKIVDVCTWQKGYYHWYRGKRNTRESFPLGLDAFEVLGAGATALPLEMVQAWAEPYLDHTLVSAKNARVVPEAFRLGNYPRDVYNRLDGRGTLRQLVQRFTNPDDRTAFLRTLYLLVQTDLAYWT